MQSSVEIQLEFGKFFNVDLFQRGYYQLRCYLKFSPKVMFTAEVDYKSRGGNDSSYNVNGYVARTKTFQILYRKEDIDLNDVFTFKVDFLIDVVKIEEVFKEVDMQLIIEMWFAEEDASSDLSDKFQMLCQRSLKLNFDPLKGLHSNLSLLFDYFHLSAVVLSIHASLLAFKHPVSLSMISLKPSKQQQSVPSHDLTGLELALFGPPIPPNSSNKNIIQAQKLRKLIGCQKHHLMCRYILSAYESIQSSFELLVTCLPSHQQFKIEHVDCVSKLEELVLKCKNLSEMTEAEEEDVLQVVHSDLTNINTQLSILWTQYLELVTNNHQVSHHLAKENHSQRAKRFAEGFFVREFCKQEALGCFDAGQHRHADISAKVRLSEYFRIVPPLPIECLETDGDHLTLPIMFEDVYSNITLPPNALMISSQSAAATSTSTACVNNNSTNGSKKALRSTPNRWAQRNNSLRNTAAMPTNTTNSNSSNNNTNNTAVVWTTKTSSSLTTVSADNDFGYISNNNDGSNNNNNIMNIDGNKIVLRRDRSTNSTSSQESENQHSNNNNNKKKRLSKFRPESLLLLGSGNIWQQQQQQLRQSGLDYRGMQVAYDAPDCQLVGYKKMDANHELAPPTIELGTFSRGSTSDSASNGSASSGRRGSYIDSSALKSNNDNANANVTYIKESNVMFPSEPDNNNCDKSGSYNNNNFGSSNNSTYLTTIATNVAATVSMISVSSTSSSVMAAAAAAAITTAVATVMTLSSSTEVASPMMGTLTRNISPPAQQRHLESSCFLFSASSLPALNDETEELETPLLNESYLSGAGGGSLPELVGEVAKGSSEASGISRSECLENINLSQKPSPSTTQQPPSSSSTQSLPHQIEDYVPIPSNSAANAFDGNKFVEKVYFSQHQVNKFSSDIGLTNTNSNVPARIGSTTFLKANQIKATNSASLVGPITGSVISEPGGKNNDLQGSDNSINNGACSVLQLLKEEYEKNKSSLREAFSKMPDLDQELNELRGTQNPEGSKECDGDEIDGGKLNGDKVQSSGQTISSASSSSLPNSTNQQPAPTQSNSEVKGNTPFPRRESRSMQISSHFHSQLISRRLVSKVTDQTVRFSHAKENLRKVIGYQGHFYSDYLTQVSEEPYFWHPEKPLSSPQQEGVHLIVCVHGLDGNSTDLRLVRTYLEMSMSGRGKVDFLMSERNQADTFSDFEVMTDRLVQEILYHINLYSMKPSKISFIGHSLGNIIIRSALSRKEMTPLLPKLHTFLSLSGPHLGMLFNNSGLVNMGIWLMQKWKKSTSLLQLSLKDHHDPRQTFMYRLSQKQGLKHFRNVLLVGSQQDRYVPFHSSRIELCKAALRDTSGMGSVYTEMVTNLLRPIIDDSFAQVPILPSSVHQSKQASTSLQQNVSSVFVRYDIYHALTSNTNNLIGRAAHIAVLDSELFIEKFISVSVLKYFL